MKKTHLVGPPECDSNYLVTVAKRSALNRLSQTPSGMSLNDWRKNRRTFAQLHQSLISLFCSAVLVSMDNYKVPGPSWESMTSPNGTGRQARSETRAHDAQLGAWHHLTAGCSLDSSWNWPHLVRTDKMLRPHILFMGPSFALNIGLVQCLPK